jgi:[ribosomal protein S18]-alanine N-acetyltransferase
MIRDYRPEDFWRLYEIDHICFRSDVAYSRAELLFYLKHPESITRVAQVQKEVLGFAIGRIETDRSAHVLTLDVVPEARRRRIGSALMASLHDAFEAKRVVVSFLEVDSANQAAQSFYGAMNYRYVETLKGYYGGRSDAYRMKRMMTLG